MKKTIFLLIAFAITFWLLPFAIVAHAADTGACYNISNSDVRSYCLAQAHHEPSICYNIKAAEIRALCLAEVRK